MKRIKLLLIFLLAAVLTHAQFPSNPTQGAANALLHSRGGSLADSAQLLPNLDTLNAPGNYYNGSVTNRPSALQFFHGLLYYRYNDAWYPLVSSNNLDSLFSQFVDSSVNTVTLINDSTIQICNGAGVCQNITISTTIVNPTSVQIISDSTITICGIDTTGGITTTICDTISIPKQQIAYVFQNGLVQNSSRIVELGNSLLHNTTINTEYFIQNFIGHTIYNYPYQFYQLNDFKNSTGVTSFLSRGSQVNTQPDYNNQVRLGINYTGAVYPNIPSDFPGYMGDRIGYWLGVNLTGDGSYGVYTDNENSKMSGMFIHTLDTAYDDAFTFFSKAPPNPTAQIPIHAGGTLLPYRIMTLYDNKNITLFGYPSTRNDGVLSKVLGTDENGNVLLGSVTGSQTCGWYEGAIVSLDSNLTFDVSASPAYVLCSDDIRRTAAFSTITLSPGDPTNPRYDAIILDTSGVNKKEGVPSANPQFPQITNDEILLTYVRINAGDTVPANYNIAKVIYDQDSTTEFYPTVVGATADFTNTAHPAHLSKAALVTNFTDGDYLFFADTTGTTYNLNNYGLIKFYIRLNEAKNITFNFTFLLDSSEQTFSLPVSNGLWGLDTSLINVYQPIAIPITAFHVIGTEFNQLRISLTGTSTSGFYIDWIQLQTGSQTTNVGTVTNVSAVGNDLFNVNVANSTTTPSLTFPLIDAPANRFWGGGTTTGPPSYTQIDLSTDATTGLLNVNRLSIGTDGDVLTMQSGVPTWIPGSTPGYDTTIVLPPLYVLPGTTKDTIGINFANGLSILGDSAVLGGEIYKNTTLTIDSTFQLIISGKKATASAGILDVTNTNATFGDAIKGTVTGSGGAGVYGLANGGIGVYGNSTSSYGVQGQGATGVYGTSSSGTGVSGLSISGIGVVAAGGDNYGATISTQYNSLTTPDSNYSVLKVQLSAPSVVGAGSAIDFASYTSSALSVSTQLASSWETFTNAFRTSKFSIIGVDTAVTKTIFTISGNGNARLNQYGSGTFTGTPAYTLAVDASGNIIETSGGGGNTIYTGDDALTSNRTVYLAGYNLQFVNGEGNQLININLEEDAQFVNIHSFDSAGYADIFMASNTNDGYSFSLESSDGSNTVNITGNAGANTLTYTADSHTVNGNWGLGATPSSDQLFLVNDGSNDLMYIDKTNFQSVIAANDNTGNGQSSLTLNGNSLDNVSFELFAAGSDGNVDIFGDAVAQTITMTADSVSIADVTGTSIASLAGTGSRTVLADANGLLSAPVSDISVKKDITPLASGLDKIMALNPVNFYYKPDWQRYGKGEQIGFIAQDIYKILPNSTYYSKNGKMGYNEIDLVPLLVKAVQELQQQINDLKKLYK